MKKALVLAGFSAIAVTGIFSESSTAEVSAKPLSVALDFSGSSGLWSNTLAGEMAKFVDNAVISARPGSEFTVRTFGDGSAENFGSWHAIITQRSRDTIRARVNSDIKNKAKRQPQNETAIIALLESGVLDCANGETALVLTDGLESSERYDYDDFLKNKPLPAPRQGILSGCTVVFLGIGNTADTGLNGTQRQQLISHWQEWMKVAGANFKAMDRL